MSVAVDGSFVQETLRRRVSEFDSSGALIASHLVEVISRDPVWEGGIDWRGRFVDRQQVFRADTIVEWEIRRHLHRDSDIARLVLGRGVVSVAVGLVLGLGATIAASRALESLLYGVEATDASTIGAVALLLGVGIVACWIPARGATRVDPVRSLKAE